MAGPTLGSINTGIAVIEAADEAAARRIMEEDPAIASGIARRASRVPCQPASRPRLSVNRSQVAGASGGLELLSDRAACPAFVGQFTEMFLPTRGAARPAHVRGAEEFRPAPSAGAAVVTTPAGLAATSEPALLARRARHRHSDGRAGGVLGGNGCTPPGLSWPAARHAGDRARRVRPWLRLSGRGARP